MKKNHIKVYDRNMNLKAILNNAYKIGYDLELNNLWYCNFTLPLDDPKNDEIIPKNFIELWDFDKRIGMFMVQPIKTVKNESNRSVTYTCEHVLGTLHSEVLFDYHQFTNYSTEFVLSQLLSMQYDQLWQLGTVQFTRFFHYAFENEDSLLNAIFSIPKPFDQSYMWTWDDTTFPFTLNLVAPDNEKVDEIRYRKNLKGITKEVDPYEIVNRIYPLGYGEGVNQLTIKKVNNGVPYLEDYDSQSAYGLHARIWADRRFEDAESLKASAQAILNQNKDPITTVSVDCINYELVDPYKIVKYGVGKIVRVNDEDTDTLIDLRINKISRSDIYGNPDDIKFELNNVRKRLETTIADLEKKQLVNETYSQGSTNIDSHDYSDNCDPTHPAIIRFYLPDDLVNVNTMTLSYQTDNFRAYAQATEGGGAIVESTSAGGGIVKSTQSGGGSTQTSSAGGGSTQTSSAGGGGTQTSSAGGGSVQSTNSAGVHRHRMFSFQVDTDSTTPPDTFKNYIAASDSLGGSSTGIFAPSGSTNDLYTEEAAGQHSHDVPIPNHTHNVTYPAHTHTVTIPNHTHQVTIPAHTHEVELPNHTHEITLPNHTHEIKHGIYELSEMPTGVVVTVDGNVVPVESLQANDIDIIPYLSVDSGGRIKRGTWHVIEITPDKLGRITANVISRLFIQSRLGGNY